MDKLISIIVPVYNVFEYVGMCLDSLLSQTYENIEIIIVDDGSTDESGKICDDYAQKYPDKIQVIHISNQGVSVARNRGIEMAKGEYLLFIDSDDWIEPKMIDILIKNLVDNDADMSICSVNLNSYKEKDQLEEECHIQLFDQNELYKEILGNKHIYGYACNKLLKKSLVGEIRFDETLTVCEDMEFIVRYTEKCMRGVYTTAKLYHYRQRSESVTGDFNYDPRKLSIIKAYEKIVPIYENFCPECTYILLRNYLKINLNIWGRMKISRYENEKVKSTLLNNIRDNYMKVIKDRRNSMGTRINIAITYMFPGVALQLKKIILKRKYK